MINSCLQPGYNYVHGTFLSVLDWHISWNAVQIARVPLLGAFALILHPALTLLLVLSWWSYSARHISGPQSIPKWMLNQAVVTMLNSDGLSLFKFAWPMYREGWPHLRTPAKIERIFLYHCLHMLCRIFCPHPESSLSQTLVRLPFKYYNRQVSLHQCPLHSQCEVPASPAFRFSRLE